MFVLLVLISFFCEDVKELILKGFKWFFIVIFGFLDLNELLYFIVFILSSECLILKEVYLYK